MKRNFNSSWKAAGIVILVLAAWMISGLFKSDDAENSDNSMEQSSPLTVEVTLAQTSRMAREINLQGQLEPIRQVLIKAQTNGEVEDVVTRRGARVAQDEALVRLAEGERGNSLAEASAAVKLARSEQSAAQSLQRQRLQSQLQLQQADAALEAALARLATVELDIARTLIRAPFDGVINSLPIERGALIERGDVVAELIDDSAFKVSASVSQHALSQITAGQPVTVNLITGETLSGALNFISSMADPQTRSFAVEALVQNSSDIVAAGISATLSIPVQEVEATFITPSSLSLGDDGELGVKILDADDRVVFQAIELVSTTLDGAWVTGIASQSRIITLGQGFVNTGEKVIARLSEPAS